MIKRLVVPPLALALAFGAQIARAEAPTEDFKTQMERYLATSQGRDNMAKAFMLWQQEAKQKQAKEEEREAKEEFEKSFKNPVNVDIAHSPVKGPADAKVTIIEFSDFQCPYCKKGKDVVDRLLAEYPKDVKVAFKHLPLPMHPEAKPSAAASIAAQKQGKFWEFHDQLFSNQHGLGKDLYEKIAKDLGLDLEKFKKDMNDPETMKLVEADAALAEKHGIQGTPGFFVGGVPVKGAYPIEYFKNIINRHLGKGEGAAKS